MSALALSTEPWLWVPTKNRWHNWWRWICYLHRYIWGICYVCRNHSPVLFSTMIYHQ
jgi:hypothetical protein